MSSDTFRCPECQATLRIQPGIEAGDLVECPRCHHQFPGPPFDNPSPPRPTSPQPLPPITGHEISESLVRPRPRFADVDNPERIADSLRRHPVADDDEDANYGLAFDDDLSSSEELSPNYRIDVNRWFELATKHYGAFLGPAIGFILLGVAIYFCCIFVGL